MKVRSNQSCEWEMKKKKTEEARTTTSFTRGLTADRYDTPLVLCKLARNNPIYNLKHCMC